MRMVMSLGHGLMCPSTLRWMCKDPVLASAFCKYFIVSFMFYDLVFVGRSLKVLRVGYGIRFEAVVKIFDGKQHFCFRLCCLHLDSVAVATTFNSKFMGFRSCF